MELTCLVHDLTLGRLPYEGIGSNVAELRTGPEDVGHDGDGGSICVDLGEYVF